MAVNGRTVSRCLVLDIDICMCVCTFIIYKRIA